MILRSLKRAIGDQNWFAVAVEILIVVVGILLALQFDQWSQDRADRALEREYLQRLVEDLEIERGRIVDAIGSTENRLAAIRRLEAYVKEPISASDRPATVPWALETVSWRSFPKVNAFVFRELQSTGRLKLIRSVALRRALAEHYTEIEHDARVGEDLSAHQRFEAATAGLATTDELIAVEQAGGVLDRIEITPERARAIVDALAARPGAMAQLPALAQHHVFNLRAIEDMRTRTDMLIGEIRLLLNESEPER